VELLAAGEHAHGRWPARQLVSRRALAQQPGQLCHVRLLDPALAVSAAVVFAGVITAAFAHLAAAVNGDLPGVPGHRRERLAFPLAQFPPGGVDELVTGPGGELIEAGDQGVAGSGPADVAL